MMHVVLSRSPHVHLLLVDLHMLLVLSSSPNDSLRNALGGGGKKPCLCSKLASTD